MRDPASPGSCVNIGTDLAVTGGFDPMKRASFLAVLSMVLAPSMAAAMGCNGADHDDKSASACIEGTQWDAALSSCVPVVTG